ncbi:hypothetical protein HK104_003040 [Borealophlyctis nickersoniae]|nr:hypothetical protein HK104_003040 [Borealophlyctis nickersoniae]
MDLIPAFLDQVRCYGLWSVVKSLAIAMVGPSKTNTARPPPPAPPASAQEHLPRTTSERSPESYKNIVIIGGSCAGIAAAMKLRQTTDLPSPYRLIIIERHSHYHYMFAFPRAAVIPGFENELFAPYDSLFTRPDDGVVVHALATRITPTHVEVDRPIPWLGGSKSLPYEYLIYATGARHPKPGNLCDEDTKESGIATLRTYQTKIERATKVLVVGGGAVGLELAAEIKEHYPEKQVTLVHSRERYLQSYKYGMHWRTYKILKDIGVTQILGDRVVLPDGGFKDTGEMITVTTKTGRKVECDLQILCTGMSPNSSLLSALSPTSVNERTGYVKVQPTLQISDTTYPNIYAAGDVVDGSDIKTGLSAFSMGALAIENIIQSIHSPKNPDDKSDTPLIHHTPVQPMIYLYFGLHAGIAQLSYRGYLYTAGTWLVRRHFSHNVGAERAWAWVNKPYNRETVRL